MWLIDADALRRAMYHEAMEKDSDFQRWDSGCWIRYKLFENVLNAQPTIMIGGYPIEHLIPFALACRQQGITEGELHDFVLNVQSAYDVVHKEFENIMKECIEGMMIHETD